MQRSVCGLRTRIRGTQKLRVRTDPDSQHCTGTAFFRLWLQDQLSKSVTPCSVHILYKGLFFTANWWGEKDGRGNDILILPDDWSNSFILRPQIDKTSQTFQSELYVLTINEYRIFLLANCSCIILFLIVALVCWNCIDVEFPFCKVYSLSPTSMQFFSIGFLDFLYLCILFENFYLETFCPEKIILWKMLLLEVKGKVVLNLGEKYR